MKLFLTSKGTENSEIIMNNCMDSKFRPQCKKPFKIRKLTPSQQKNLNYLKKFRSSLYSNVEISYSNRKYWALIQWKLLLANSAIRSFNPILKEDKLSWFVDDYNKLTFSVLIPGTYHLLSDLIPKTVINEKSTEVSQKL